MKEMEGNPTLKAMCTIPLNCAIVCHLHRSAGLDKLHVTTVTKLYNEYMLTLVRDDTLKHFAIDALPCDVQKPWWDLCELAFSTSINNMLVFSQEEVD